MTCHKIDLTCSDGVTLCGRVYAAEGDATGALVIAAALGVPGKIYHDIALFFAAEGYSVLTFDYRGLGDRLLDKPPRLSEWGSLDIQAAIECASGLPGGQQLFFIGHSIGGQLLGLAPSADKLKGTVFVAASFPFWKRYPMPRRLSIGFVFGVVVPVLSTLRSSIPLGILGMGSQRLPSSLVSDWARWVLKDDYLLDKSFGFDSRDYLRLSQPLLVFGFDDDWLVPVASLDKLLKFYGSMQVEKRLIASGKFDAAGIGHFGFFRKRRRSDLWADTLAWLQANQD
jgi:predicted alpha/beta hydrolase